ncbi:thiamine pyrophosphate-dependent dehydrogenase E1 component subunit alpha [Kitasatospora sp. NPDC094019]|uniref:thiamine pyrophosphate-dependent dehydrogenase E1 component subunit alpha n=1 Tax=Kitasatospora sp. NPDC094019 TaxID=3364091 RepID=UPI00380D9B09
MGTSRTIDLTLDQIAEIYRTMSVIRAFEDRLHGLAKNLPGAVHLYSGQEAVAAGVCAALAPDDYLASTHRGHGHAIAKGCDVEAMMKELYGRPDGICGGKGGSMHIADFDRGMLGANGLAGGGVPLACGAALTARQQSTGQVSVAFTGDGGANQGAVLESLVLARMLDLPVIFAIENNGYAQATPAATHFSGTDMAQRAAGFGIPGEVVDGYDVLAVHAATAEAVRRARAGEGPTVLEFRAERFHGHMELWDDQSYRPGADPERLRTDSDPLLLLRSRIADGTVGGPAAFELDRIDRDATALVEAAVAAAEQPFTVDPRSLLDHVYTR